MRAVYLVNKEFVDKKNVDEKVIQIISFESMTLLKARYDAEVKYSCYDSASSGQS